MHLLFWSCCFILSCTLPRLRVCALPTEHGATPPTDVSIAPLNRRAIRFTNIDQVFDHAFRVGDGTESTVLDPEFNSVTITMKAGAFDTNMRSMAIYNRYKATVLFMITARGVIFITIPRKLLLDVTDNRATYDSRIRKPIITQLKRLITIWSRVREKTTIKQWAFPDALQIVTITHYARTRAEGVSRETVRFDVLIDLEDEIYEFWTRQSYHNRDQVETQHSIQNVLGERTRGHFTDRFRQFLFSPGGPPAEQAQKPAFTPDNGRTVHDYGIAITWEPEAQVNADGTPKTIVRCKIWIGTHDTVYPYYDERLVKQDLGWYPDGIEPLRSKGPNVGCAEKKNDGENSGSALDPLNELRTQSGCNTIQEGCAGEVLNEVRAGYECAPALDPCGPMDTDSILAELGMDVHEMEGESNLKFQSELKKLQEGFVCVPKESSHQRYTCPLEPIAKVLGHAKCVPELGKCLLDHLFLTLELCDAEVSLMDSMDPRRARHWQRTLGLYTWYLI